MKKIILIVIIVSICVSNFYCNDDKSSKVNHRNSKDSANNNLPENKILFDTLSFLKENNFSESSFLSIPSGGSQTLHVTSIYFPHFEMGDNSKLIIGSELDSCTIIIANGQFGQNCLITSEGTSGRNAPKNPADPWISGWWQAPNVTQGDNGVNGIDGTNATSGKKINLRIGILTVGSLKIAGSGGNGGNGSEGGNGEIGGNRDGGILGNITSCGDGGNGGNGGRGGDAGNGGDLLIRAWPENGSIDMPTIQQNLSAVSQGGIRGIGGTRGHGSRGGNNCPSGTDGRDGNNGLGAANGIVDLKVIPKPASFNIK